MPGGGSLKKSKSEAWDYLHERAAFEDRGYATPCWVWKLTPTEWGYARAAVPGFGFVRVHRAAYELAHGPIAGGLHIDHLCRVRLCVNPDHLEAVTQAENNRRTTGIRATAEFCVRGHARTPENIRHNRGCRLCHNEDQVARTASRKAATA